MSRLITPPPLLLCICFCICLCLAAVTPPTLWAEDGLELVTQRIIDPALRGVWHGVAVSTDGGKTTIPGDEEFAVVSALRLETVDPSIASWDLQQAIHGVNPRGGVMVWVLQFRQRNQVMVTSPRPGVFLAQFYDNHGFDEHTNPERFRVLFVVRR